MMVVKRRSTREAEARIIKLAQIKKTRSTDTTDFVYVAGKFREAVMNIRNIMQNTPTTVDYSNFFGGYEQCEILLQDPAYRASQDAQFAYSVFLGVDQWMRHEADKLGEDYIPPKHFFKAWLLADPPVDLTQVANV